MSATRLLGQWRELAWTLLRYGSGIRFRTDSVGAGMEKKRREQSEEFNLTAGSAHWKRHLRTRKGLWHFALKRMSKKSYIDLWPTANNQWRCNRVG